MQPDEGEPIRWDTDAVTESLQGASSAPPPIPTDPSMDPLGEPGVLMLGPDTIPDPSAALLVTNMTASVGSPGDDRTTAQVEALGQQLEERLTRIEALLERDVRAEATREKVVDRLHAELQEYKQDLVLKMLKPVFVDLIQLHDDMGKVIAAETERSQAEAPEPSESESSGHDASAKLCRVLDGFQQGIEDILYRQGVEAYTVEGEAFDPQRQRAIRTLPNDEPARDKTVAHRLRKGFAADHRVVRPELVAVYARANNTNASGTTKP